MLPPALLPGTQHAAACRTSWRKVCCSLQLLRAGELLQSESLPGKETLIACNILGSSAIAAGRSLLGQCIGSTPCCQG